MTQGFPSLTCSVSATPMQLLQRRSWWSPSAQGLSQTNGTPSPLRLWPHLAQSNPAPVLVRQRDGYASLSPCMHGRRGALSCTLAVLLARQCTKTIVVTEDDVDRGAALRRLASDSVWPRVALPIHVQPRQFSRFLEYKNKTITTIRGYTVSYPVLRQLHTRRRKKSGVSMIHTVWTARKWGAMCQHPRCG